MHEEKLKTLIVEDEVSIRSLLCEFLEELPLDVTLAKDGQEAWDLFQKQSFDLVITDIHMPLMNGLDLAEKIITKDYSIPVLIITSFDDRARILKALQIGVFDFITKPVVAEFLVSRVQRAIDKRHLILAEAKIIDLLHEMMGIPHEAAIQGMSMREQLEYIQELVTVVSIRRERELSGK